MPTIYTRGPAKVEITERNGCGPLLILGVVILAAASAGTADKFMDSVRRFFNEVLSVTVDVLEVFGVIIGVALAAAAVTVAVRLALRVRRRRLAPVHLITDAAPPRAITGPKAGPSPEDATELAARWAWRDGQWVSTVRAQSWDGIPREWSEPPGSWPDQQNQWGEQ